MGTQSAHRMACRLAPSGLDDQGALDAPCDVPAPADAPGRGGTDAIGSPAPFTNRTGTTMPFAQWPGMWQPTNQPDAAVAASDGTVQVTSTRSPEPTTIRRAS